MAVALIAGAANRIVVLAASAAHHFKPIPCFASLDGMQTTQRAHESHLETVVEGFTDERGWIEGSHFDGCTQRVPFDAGLPDQVCDGNGEAPHR